MDGMDMCDHIHCGSAIHWCRRGGPTRRSAATALLSASWKCCCHPSIPSGQGLTGLGPLAALLHIRDAQRRHDAHDLVHRDLAELLGHQQPDQVIDVRQALAGPRHDGDGAVEAERRDASAGRLDVGGVGVQTLDRVLETCAAKPGLKAIDKRPFGRSIIVPYARRSVRPVCRSPPTRRPR